MKIIQLINFYENYVLGTKVNIQTTNWTDGHNKLQSGK